MDLKAILDERISLDGADLPTLREIVEQHFARSADGNVAMAKMLTAQYVSLLESAASGGSPAGGAATGAASEKAASAGSRRGTDADALMTAFGLPMDADGRVDLRAAVAGAMTPEGRKTPVGALLGTLLGGLAEGMTRPRA